MDLLITARQVLIGPRGGRIVDGAVLVQGSTITAIGRRAEVEPRATPNTSRAHLPDATVMPGLLDCHVHLAFNAGRDPVAALTDDDDATVLLGMAGRARQLVDAGVTTVRDLGDRGRLSVRLRDAIAAGVVPGPRILAATVPLTVPGGHCWFLGGEVDGEHAIREMVGRNAEAGADVIKVMVTGGHLTPGGAAIWESQFTTAQVRVAVEEAKRHGLPVAAHAHGTEGIAAAVDAGVDTIEHCTWIGNGQLAAPPELIARIVADGIAVCPAIGAHWRSYEKSFGHEVANALLDRLRWMEEQGVRLVAGTDAGIPGALFDDPVGGLQAFAHVGFSNDRIIELATVDAAQALGLADRTGRLAAGYDADLLVVDGDPLADLDALRRIRLVLARGRPHAPAAFATRIAGSAAV